MAKYPRKPSMRKLPKRPKQSASLESWKKFEDRVKEIQKVNRKNMADWEASKKRIDADLKKKAQLQKKTQGLGRI